MPLLDFIPSLGIYVQSSHFPRILDSFAKFLLAYTIKRHNIIRKRTSKGGSFHWNAQVSSDDDDKETMMMMTVPILDLISGEQKSIWNAAAEASIERDVSPQLEEEETENWHQGIVPRTFQVFLDVEKKMDRRRLTSFVCLDTSSDCWWLGLSLQFLIFMY